MILVLQQWVSEVWWTIRGAARETFWPVFLGLFALWLIRPGGTHTLSGLRRRYMAVFVVSNGAQLSLANEAVKWGSGWYRVMEWPRWLPLLVIAMFASTRVFGRGAAYRRAVVLLPHAIGQCAECRYPGIHERCPECGTSRSPERPPRSWRPFVASLVVCGLAVTGPWMVSEITSIRIVHWTDAVLPGLLVAVLVSCTIWAVVEIRGRPPRDDGPGSSPEDLES